MRVKRAYGAPSTVAHALVRAKALPRALRPEYEGFVPLPSNILGLEAALMLGSGVSPFVAVVGPTGWGKSHLMRVAAEQFQWDFGVRPKVRRGGHLLNRGRWDHPAPLLLDDVQQCLGRPREQQALRNALELRVRLARPTMIGFTGGQAIEVNQILPQLEMWSIAEVPTPHPVERQSILRQMAEQEGLVLSDRLVCLLAKLVDRSGDALLGLVKRLGLIQREWMTFEDEMLALGVARPHMSDPNRVLKWVTSQLQTIIEPLGLDQHEDLARSLAIYYLRKVLGIGESDVSQYYRIEPGDVFSYEHAFEAARLDPRVQRLERVCQQDLNRALDLF
ncbi:MAG: hypothetical protein JNK63_08335 [Chthonomonas sp.]|nr:hypothetical protein [Chthonomonas sp.]